MPELFQPPHEDLPPISDLMAIADVTEDDVRDAADKWRENPPDEGFSLILEAEEE